MESFAKRDVGAEARGGVSHSDTIREIDGKSHCGFRGEPLRHVNAILNPDLQTSWNGIGLRAVVHLQLEAYDIARSDTDRFTMNCAPRSSALVVAENEISGHGPVQSMRNWTSLYVRPAVT